MTQATRAENWCFLTGRVAALEARLIHNDYMQRMATVKNLDELFLSVSDTAYKDDFPIIGKLHEGDAIISEAWLRQLRDIDRYSPDRGITGMFLVQDEFQSLKAYLKDRLAQLQLPAAVESGISDELWARVYDDLRTDLPAFWSRAAAIIRRELGEEQSELAPQVIDLVLDSEYLIQQVANARRLGYPLIIDWAETLRLAKAAEMIWRAKASGSYDLDLLRRLFLRDTLNLNVLHELVDLPLDDWYGRLRTTLLEPIIEDVFSHDQSERITRLAKRGDDLLLNRVRHAKFAAFGPDRVFGYLCGLRIETFNLRLVIAGKVNKISTQLLQARLREQYV